MHPLVVWTKASASRVYSSLSPAFGRADFPVKVVNDLTKIPEGPIVLALGGEPKDLLEAQGIVPKKRKITSLRENIPWTRGDQKIVISYSPGIHEVDHGMYVDLVCDARMAARAAATGSFKPILGHYEYVDDFSKLISEIEAKHAETGKPVPCAHDTETLGANPWGVAHDVHTYKKVKGVKTIISTIKVPAARFVTWQWSHRPGYSAVKFFQNQEDFVEAMYAGLWEQAEWLFNTEKVIHRLANGKFDLVWHWVKTIKGEKRMTCRNFKMDTTLVGSILNENRSNGLDVHAKIYTDMGGYSDAADNTWDKSRMDLRHQENPQAFLEYAGGDTDATLQVAEAERAELVKQPGLARFYVNCLHPAARAFEVIERGGVFIDMDAYRALESEVDQEIETLTQKAVKILGGRLFIRHRDPGFPGGINIMKASLLCDFLFSPSGLGIKPLMVTEKEKEPSTALEHLLMFKDHPKAGPFIALLDDYSSAQKTKGTYITGFQKHIRSDGRFHPSYFLFVGNRQKGDGGAVTGRLSAKDPAFQTIPKHTKWGKKLRKVFAAPEGFLVLERDYSQGELRVVACIADEKTMIQAYRDGKDLHCLTGARIAGMTYEDVIALEEVDEKRFQAIRQPAKPANFGLLYGQWVDGFRAYAEANYGVKLTKAEAEKIWHTFFQLYPGLVDYHEKYKGIAHATGQVVSPLGRIRHLPLVNSPNRQIRGEEERKAINSPVQSTLSDMMIWALGLENAQGGFDEAPSFGMIHDASYDYLPEDNWEAHVKRKIDIMENLPFEKVGWQPQLKFVADAKVGKNMAELYKPAKFKAMKEKAA